MTFYISMLTRKQISISFKVPLMLLFLLVKPNSCTNSTICIENLYIIQALDQYCSIQLVPFLQTWHDVVCVDPFIPILSREKSFGWHQTKRQDLFYQEYYQVVLLLLLLASYLYNTAGFTEEPKFQYQVQYVLYPCLVLSEHFLDIVSCMPITFPSWSKVSSAN